MKSRAGSTGIGRKIAMAIVVYVLAFLAVEVVARVGAYFAYGRSPYFLFYGLDVWASDEQGHKAAHEGYFKFHPSRTLHQYGLFAQPTPIQINSLGFRGGEFDAQKPPGVFRIICLGGSSTFGFYNEDDGTYPAQLELLFDAEDAGGVEVEVINTGVPQAVSLHLRAMFEGELLSYDPDVITLYTGYNDAVRVKDANAAQRASRWMHSHFAAYVGLKRLVSALGGPEIHSRWSSYGQSGTEIVQRQIDLHIEDYERNVLRIIELAKSHGTDIVLVRQAVDVMRWEKGGIDESYDERTERIRRTLQAGGAVIGPEVNHMVHAALMAKLAEIAEAAGLVIVDFVRVIDEQPELMASYVHLREAGNALLADQLHRAIIDLPRFPRPEPGPAARPPTSTPHAATPGS